MSRFAFVDPAAKFRLPASFNYYDYIETERELFKLGVPLGELWWLNDLAAHLRQAGRSRCLLTAPPLRLPGAVGSPTTPVATV